MAQTRSQKSRTRSRRVESRGETGSGGVPSEVSEVKGSADAGFVFLVFGRLCIAKPKFGGGSRGSVTLGTGHSGHSGHKREMESST